MSEWTREQKNTTGDFTRERVNTGVLADRFLLIDEDNFLLIDDEHVLLIQNERLTPFTREGVNND